MRCARWIAWPGLVTVALVSLPEGGRALTPARAVTPPTWRGDPCRQDADCGWDDPCRPHRCQKAAAPAACDKSFPPPGDCRCVEQQCTLRPRDPAHGTSTAAGCARDADCSLDVPTATCHLRGKQLLGPIVRQGPLCTCDRATRRCRFGWSPPVPCRSFRECWFERSPRLRPVRATRPRARPVRPCRDGEIDSVCRAGFCQVVSWDC